MEYNFVFSDAERKSLTKALNDLKIGRAHV